MIFGHLIDNNEIVAVAHVFHPHVNYLEIYHVITLLHVKEKENITRRLQAPMAPLMLLQKLTN